MNSPLIAASILAALTLVACDKAAPEPPRPRRARSSPPRPEVPEPADLIKEDLTVGTGAEAKDGDKVKVNYTGRLLKTNFMFDTSVAARSRSSSSIGKGEVIKGWDLGVVGMKVGGKRKLTIPSKLGYGDERARRRRSRQGHAGLRRRAALDWRRGRRRSQGRRRRAPRTRKRREEVAAAPRAATARERESRATRRREESD